MFVFFLLIYLILLKNIKNFIIVCLVVFEEYMIICFFYFKIEECEELRWCVGCFGRYYNVYKICVKFFEYFFVVILDYVNI